ncbi:MAG: tRNA pseudouridine(38-40) synthase TruA [Chlamydiae bacterium]|nr:tRNA pseudouridine(38-40) synthase TruA [Chlamydiota bacterium]
MQKKYKLVISYDGTNYNGWQSQKTGSGIQQIIEKTLHIILREKISICGSGRTDAGVHALGQVAHFTPNKSIEIPRLHLSLNALLPKDIRICTIQPVSPEFHARFSAKSKIYRYHLHTDKIPNPFNLRYAYHLPHRFDPALVKRALPLFIGKQDFTSFTSAGSSAKSAIREMKRLELVEQEGGIYLEFEADGFLYKMVRNIVGTLLDLSKGKIRFEAIPEIFAAKDRKKAGRCAPPQGLFLVKIFY